MIARLLVSLPFGIWVTDGLTFSPQEYDDEGFKVILGKLAPSERPPAHDVPDLCEINGLPSSLADLLVIDFQKETMERREGATLDPPLPVIGRAVNSFLTRFRHISQHAEVRPVDISIISWFIQYINDDGSDLEVETGKVRRRGSRAYNFPLIWLDQDTWDEIIRHKSEFDPPAWETMLLDARNELPKIGPAIVLAATALEVFISKTLNQLATIKRVPPDLWRWINERKDPDSRPKANEQFDELLKHVTGHSLKEEPKLWEFFQHLKAARNSFVHEGLARIGRNSVDVKQTDLLVLAAGNIISKVRGWLPAELQWQEHKRELRMHMGKKLGWTEDHLTPDEIIREAEQSKNLPDKGNDKAGLERGNEKPG
jgi:hypothetical protein